MTEREEALGRLPARSIDQIFVELMDVRRRAMLGQPVEVPLVTLHLRSGRDLRGWPLDQGFDDRGRPMLLLQAMGDDPRRPPDDAIYLDPTVIDAVTVHAAGALSLSLEALRPPPSTLELKRAAETTARQLTATLGVALTVEGDWDGLRDDGDARRVIDDLLRDAAPVLLEIARDEVGRTALVGRVRRLRLAVAGAPGATLADDALVLAVAHGPGAARLSRGELREAIEACF